MVGSTTEVLNDDLKGLRKDLHEVESHVTHEIHKVAIEVAKLSVEFNFAKWLLGLTLGACISGIVVGIWWAATLSANVKNLEASTNDRFAKMEASTNDRFARMEASTNDRFAKLEESIAKVIEYTKPKVKAEAAAKGD